MSKDFRISHEGTGVLVKITGLSDDGHQIFCLKTNGESTVLKASDPVKLELGAIFVATSTGLIPAPNNVWFGENQLGVVVKKGEDYLVLDEGNSRLPRMFTGPILVDVAEGNTVEYNDFEGVVDVIHATSLIRSLRDEDIAVDPDEEFLQDAPNTDLSFEDFGGYAHVIEKARELIETPLERAAELKAIGAKPVRGVLFTGPPGTGKTHLARIIAQVSGARFYLVRGPQLVTKWVGDSEEILRNLFKRASDTGPSIIFFDEIDSIATRRAANSHESSNRLVTQFLTEMDGFNNSDNVIVIAATNRVEELDSALLRPGRFDWEIEFGLPTVVDRLSILQLKSKQYTTRGDLKLELLAAVSEGWSGAKLDLLWKDAALVAAGQARRSIRHEDLMVAMERVASRPDRSVKVESTS